MIKNVVVDRCDFQPGSIVDGKYTVKKLLGEGSFGAVYLVNDGRGSSYALKLLRLWEVPSEIRKELTDRFEMEFETGQINCDNLVRSLNYGMVGGNPYIIMEYCPGGDLQPYLGKPNERTPLICRDILIGLNALHSKGKVHRDLKPENVLFKQDGSAALTDFGISGDRNHRMTQCNIFQKPNQIFGTWAYMPPEQVSRARGGATVLPTTDIFSFGVLIYQLLTGKLPFGKLESHNDLAEYTKRGEKGQWDRATLDLIHEGRRWEQLIDGCLIPDFKSRLQTVADVYKLLPQQDIKCTPIQKKITPVYSPKVVTHGFQLRIMQGEEHGRIYDLTALMEKNRRILTLGRQYDNIIFIKSKYSEYLSRHHCTFESSPDGKEWVIRDGQWDGQSKQWCYSRNGTFVNSTPVGPTGFFLKPGDIIAIGDVTIRFENY